MGADAESAGEAGDFFAVPIVERGGFEPINAAWVSVRFALS